jgi:hypothetical protein
VISAIVQPNASIVRVLVDRAREKFQLTFNPGGYLRRVGDDERTAST